MRFLVTFVMVAAVSSVQALTIGQLERMVHNYAVCARETNIDPELITQIRHGEYIDSQPLKQFLHCIGQRVGIVDENGAIRTDNLLKWTAEAVGEELANELIGACVVATRTGFESTYHVVKCIHDKSGSTVVNII